MNTQPSGASAPLRTARLPFSSINSAGDLLFEVRPNIPAISALEEASCYMAAARDIAAECANHSAGENPDHQWGVYYLVQMAKAVLDAAIYSLHEEENSHD